MKAKKKNGIKWTNFIGLFFAGIINACGVGLFLVPLESSMVVYLVLHLF